MTAQFHIAFNIAPGARLHRPARSARLAAGEGSSRRASRAADPAAPRYLDESALETPSLALADAARETLRMGDVVEVMLRQVMTALMTNDRALVARSRAWTTWSTSSTRRSSSTSPSSRAAASTSARAAARWRSSRSRINLEHVGDIIDKNLTELAAKKIKRKFQFSTEGAAELAAFHKRILESLRIALGVFMSGDVRDARKLIAEKTELRNAELAAAERHFERLRAGPAGDAGDDLAAPRRACAT